MRSGLAERWEMAAKEGLVIYMRGRPVYDTLPDDLPERMMDYAAHVLAVLAMLFDQPGTSPCMANATRNSMVLLGRGHVTDGAFKTLVPHQEVCHIGQTQLPTRKVQTWNLNLYLHGLLLTQPFSPCPPEKKSLVALSLTFALLSCTDEVNRKLSSERQCPENGVPVATSRSRRVSKAREAANPENLPWLVKGKPPFRQACTAHWVDGNG
jgi:hypothetical protein